jgi:hypothetical protein
VASTGLGYEAAPMGKRIKLCDIQNLKNNEAMTRVGLQRHSKKITYQLLLLSIHLLLIINFLFY